MPFPGVPPFYTPTSRVCESQFLTSSLQIAIFRFIFNIAILLSRKWYLHVVLSFIFPMTNDVDHLFLCSLAISMEGPVDLQHESPMYVNRSCATPPVLNGKASTSLPTSFSQHK